MATYDPDASKAEKPARRRGRPKAVDLGDKRRAQLTAAAFKVFSETSYDEAAVSAIAKEAGFGQGTLYRYVDGKRELLDLVVDWSIEKLMEAVAAEQLLELADRKPSGAQVREAIVEIGNRLYALVDEYPGLIRILTVQVGSVDREVKYRLTGLFATLDALVGSLLERVGATDTGDPDEHLRRRTVARAMPGLAIPGLIQVITRQSDSAESRAAYLDAAGQLERHGALGRRKA